MCCIFKGFVTSSSSLAELSYSKMNSRRILFSFIPPRLQTNNFICTRSDKWFMPYFISSHNCLANRFRLQIDHNHNCLSNRFRLQIDPNRRFLLTSGLFHNSLGIMGQESTLCSRHYQYNNHMVVLSRLFCHGMIRQHGSSDNNKNQMKVEELVRDILKETQKVDVMAGSVPYSHIEHLVKGLHSDGFEPDSIESLLSGKLWLLQQPKPTLTLCRLLLGHGMAPDLVCQVIHGIPHSYQKCLHLAPDKINKILLFLRNFGFSEEEIYSVVSQDSSVLFDNERSIRMAISRIKSFFPAADTKKVVCMSPNVLFDNWSSVQAKFDYCIFTMGYTQADIVRSHFFSHSLNHIQDRHIFLLRAGVFKVINRKVHPSLNPNPPLKHVVDSSNSSFVKMVQGLSVQDYVTFAQMRAIERGTDESEEEDV